MGNGEILLLGQTIPDALWYIFPFATVPMALKSILATDTFGTSIGTVC